MQHDWTSFYRLYVCISAKILAIIKAGLQISHEAFSISQVDRVRASRPKPQQTTYEIAEAIAKGKQVNNYIYSYIMDCSYLPNCNSI